MGKGKTHVFTTLEIEDLHECSCFIEFVKRVVKKRYNASLAEHFYLFFAKSIINSIIQEHKC